ncbi:unnamed protein product [Lepeophtheirus salmonis]|nr:unnamed protein product [Lepeophtheirus salmonis]CAF2940462.1 unnamed protein product [Lepeophtheirus salmonis]
MPIGPKTIALTGIDSYLTLIDAIRCLLFRYSNSLELWKLGETKDNLKNSLEVVSPDEKVSPQLKRIKSQDKFSDTHHIKFIPNSNKCLLINNVGKLILLSILEEEDGMSLHKLKQIEQNQIKLTSSISKFDIEGEYIVLADFDDNVVVVNYETGDLVSHLPSFYYIFERRTIRGAFYDPQNEDKIIMYDSSAVHIIDKCKVLENEKCDVKKLRTLGKSSKIKHISTDESVGFSIKTINNFDNLLFFTRIEKGVVAVEVLTNKLEDKLPPITSEICGDDPLCSAIDHLHNRISSMEQPVWQKSLQKSSWKRCDEGKCSCEPPKISGTVDCWGKFHKLDRIPEDQIIPLNVEILDLGNNHIPHLNPNIFKNLIKLKELNLFGMGLKHLSAFIFETNFQIKTLKIQDNMLRILEPNLLSSIHLLEYLDISGNMFEKLPDHIFKATPRLKMLNLSNNKIKVISPMLLSNLTILEVLDLSQNRLRVLDMRSFIDLIRLNKLFMSRNIIETLPEDLFKNNMKLKSIDLSINELQRLPPTLYENIEDLKYLFLAGNKFQSLNDENRFPKNITSFGHDNNAIKNFSLTSLKSLKTLRLNLNQITHLKFEDFSNSINELYLHRNLIETFNKDRSFEHLNSLVKLTIRDNYWTCDCKIGSLVKWLNQFGINYDSTLCEAPADFFGMHINSTIALQC